MSTEPTIAEQLAAFSTTLRYEDISEPARRHAALQLMDTIGVARAAARTGASPAVQKVASSAVPCDPGGLVVGQGSQIDLPLALLVNGALAHALDFDNTHTGSMVHVGAAVGPMAWTLGSSLGAPGQEVLRAYVAGVECAARLGSAIPGGFHRGGFHATSVVGIFGALVAGACLVQASPECLVNAMGIAGSLAAGLLEYHNSGTANKQLHPGLAARDAYVALQLAMAGADGPATVFEGSFGLFATHLRQQPLSVGTDSLGQVWEVEQVTTKPYPACNLIHFALDCLGEMGGAVEPEAIEAVEVVGPPEIVPLVVEPAASKIAPRNAYEAKFSVQHCVARYLVDGELRVDSFRPEAVGDPVVAALARKVTFRPTEDSTYPAKLGGSVRLVLTDGEERHAAVADAKGSPGHPLGEDEIVAKFAATAVPPGGASAAVDLAKRLLSIADVDDVQRLMRDALVGDLGMPGAGGA